MNVCKDVLKDVRFHVENNSINSSICACLTCALVGEGTSWLAVMGNPKFYGLAGAAIGGCIGCISVTAAHNILITKNEEAQVLLRRSGSIY